MSNTFVNFLPFLKKKNEKYEWLKFKAKGNMNFTNSFISQLGLRWSKLQISHYNDNLCGLAFSGAEMLVNVLS